MDGRGRLQNDRIIIDTEINDLQRHAEELM
jgi:hypothetical protein